MKRNRFLTIEEINALGDYKKVRRNKILKILLFIFLTLIAIGMIVGGIILVNLYGESNVGGILLIIFGGFFLMVLLCVSVVVFAQSKDNKYRDLLMVQAVKESFGKDAILNQKASISPLFLKETGISPLNIEKTNEQILVLIDEVLISLIDLKTINPLLKGGADFIGAVAQGGLGGVTYATINSIDGIVNKQTINNMFDGTVIVVPSLKKKVKGVVEIRTKNCFSPNSFLLENKNKFEVESLVATDRYNFYATNKEEGFYIVTPEIVDIFKDLDEFYKAGVVGVFKEDYLVIGINNFHLNVNKFYNDKNLSSKEMYFKIKDHLKVINEIINKLNLKGLK